MNREQLEAVLRAAEKLQNFHELHPEHALLTEQEFNNLTDALVVAYQKPGA